MTIGERIAARRTELGMTQEELATKLGYKSRSSINKIETGVNELTQRKIVAFAKALDTSPEYIMGWEDPENQKKITESVAKVVAISKVLEESYSKIISQEFIDNMNRLTEQNRKAIEKFAEYLYTQQTAENASSEKEAKNGK